MNTELFKNNTIVKNEAGGDAYSMSSLHALAQYAFTGTFNNSFYVSAKMQLDTVLQLCSKVADEDVAVIAVAARKMGYMKDMPAALCAYLHNKNIKLLANIFNKVIDNGKMLSTFVTMVQSGKFGRKSFGSATKRLVNNWFANREANKLLWDYAAMGGKLKSILKIFHPKPATKEHEAFFAWVAGYENNKDGVNIVNNYPQSLNDYKKFQVDQHIPPNVPFQLIEGLVSDAGWKNIAKNASWQQTLKSLNTFKRHGVFKEDEMVHIVASKLRDNEAMKAAKVFPYQILAAFNATLSTPSGQYSFGDKKGGDEDALPREITQAMEYAMEFAVSNVETFPGKVLVAVDVSGSMATPITGEDTAKGKKESKVQCYDAAALIAASIVRNNPKTDVLLFNSTARRVQLDFTQSILSNAKALVANAGGGTSCAAPLAMWNKEDKQADLVVIISDYESWNNPQYSNPVAMNEQWNILKKRCPKAKLVCVDLAPNKTSQVQVATDRLLIGGVSDYVFSCMFNFARDELNGDYWINYIKAHVI